MKHHCGRPIIWVIVAACSFAGSAWAKNSGQAAQQSVPIPVPVVSASPTASPSASPTVLPTAATVETTQGTLGEFLVDAQGMSLYRFLADTAGVSNCNGTCTQTWPPLPMMVGQSPVAGGDAQQNLMAVITRSDGSLQVSYNGAPLYTYAGDVNPGDTNGQAINSFGNVWYLVKPDGTSLLPAPVPSGAPSPTPTPTPSSVPTSVE